jgi:predicted  nucleic acid-binding Zn-ribbon protein
MGKKHRETRKELKAQTRELEGFRENEFGELVKVMSKADARRKLLARERGRIEWEIAIISSMSEGIKREIDEEVFAEIERAIQPVQQTASP